MTGVLNDSIIRLHVNNEAIIRIICSLYANSTGNITLFVEPASEWNMTNIFVGIGQEINVTVMNGVVRTPPSDVPAIFKLFAQLESITDEVWGTLIVVVINRGWEPVPWFLLPGVLALVLLGIKRYRKMKHKTVN